MKVKDLIQALSYFKGDTEVCIMDWRKNLHYADDEGQGNGIDPNFKVEFLEKDVNKPFVALFFDNVPTLPPDAPIVVFPFTDKLKLEHSKIELS